ncbi:hypothetical protein LshimejAT787_0701770 [Lyophyllum shimeji]|uniref:Uncharacterized protein n=1 Tax=Lyophyllum shimeji TaxID=47721 RepID=A0A9P3PNH6_LYOSH|nr:hypothetical protein LshimejAT787_0701770 [Lyophyllum shimeji]
MVFILNLCTAHILVYTPSELVTKYLSDLAHPDGVVPFEHQLKGSSTLLLPAPSVAVERGLRAVQAGIIDVLFRARTKAGAYAGRVRAMPRLCWGHVVRAAEGCGAAAPVQPEAEREKKTSMAYREAWVQLAGHAQSAGAVVAAGAGVEDMLGRAPVREALKEDIRVGAGKASEGPVGEEAYTRTAAVWAG